MKETWLAGQMGAIFFSLLACDEEAALAGLADAWRDVGWLGSSVGGSAMSRHRMVLRDERHTRRA